MRGKKRNKYIINKVYGRKLYLRVRYHLFYCVYQTPLFNNIRVNNTRQRNSMIENILKTWDLNIWTGSDSYKWKLKNKNCIRREKWRKKTPNIKQNIIKYFFLLIYFLRFGSGKWKHYELDNQKLSCLSLIEKCYTTIFFFSFHFKSCLQCHYRCLSPFFIIDK